MSKQTWLNDIEVFPNLFFVGIEDYRTQVQFSFEVSPYKDQREELYIALNTFKGYMVTFNGIHYDCVVLNYFVKDYKRLKALSVNAFLYDMKCFSNLAIDGDNNFDKIKWYKWYKNGWTDIDLFMYWAKSSRKSKSISLKTLGIQLNHPEVQELPYHHTKILTFEEIEVIKQYNLVNDIGILKALFNEMKPDISLRHYINQTYGLECWSMDAPKICSEYLMGKYCEKTVNNSSEINNKKRELKKYRYEPPDNWKIGEYLPKVNFKTKFFQDLYQEIVNSGSNFFKSFGYNVGTTSVRVNLGIGGCHIINKNETYSSTDDELIIDQDVQSLYPQLLDNHGFIRPELRIVLDEYLELKKDRVEAKRSGDKKKDTFLKLCLNGFTGLADSKETWLYSPQWLIALRVYGQLIQMRALEELAVVEGIRVISNNTDGTTSIVRKDKLDIYHKINQDISKEFNIIWEYAIIKKIIYTHGNGYLAEIVGEYMIDENLNKFNESTKTKIKRKGIYRIDFDEKGNREIPLGDSVNELVIPKALQLYWLKDIPIEESISNPEKYGFSIYDYCCSKKINKDYAVYHNEKQVQNVNRYYFCKTGPYLFKKKKSKTTYEHVNVGEGVLLFNKYEEKPFEEYNINYKHYIAKARETIDGILMKEAQLTLF